MEGVNRSAIIVIPKQPFLDWLRLVDPDFEDVTLAELQTDPIVYLIPEVECDEDLSTHLRKFCVEIFEEHLDEWIADDTLWPMDRGFEAFSRWFAVSFHSTVIDYVEEPVAGQ